MDNKFKTKTVKTGKQQKTNETLNNSKNKMKNKRI